MMLLDRKDVLDILRCPRSGSPLTESKDKLTAESSGEKIDYEMIDGYPVLIDFGKSVLRKDDVPSITSVVERHSYSGLMGLFKRLVSPPKPATAENVAFLLDLLTSGNEPARVLIVGGGSIGQGMEPFYRDSRIELVSFDIYASPNVQFLADAHQIPLPENSFHAVIVQAVLEHVLAPEKVVSEIFRVLKKKGLVYSETPFLQQVHEGAYDFTRFTESGHRYLFRNFGLIRSGASAGAGTQLLWSLDHFSRGLSRSRRFGKMIKLLFFWLQYCDRIIPEPFNIDSASGVFFMGRKQEADIEVKEIITHYKGAQ